MRLALPIAVLLLAACTPPEGPQMQPGADCLSCHLPGFAFTWTAAGTVYKAADAAPDHGLDHAWVELTDAKGTQLVLETNPAGNFYTAETIFLPLRVAIRHGDSRVQMVSAAPHGSCGLCHGYDGVTANPGRVHVP